MEKTQLKLLLTHFPRNSEASCVGFIRLKDLKYCTQTWIILVNINLRKNHNFQVWAKKSLSLEIIIEFAWLTLTPSTIRAVLESNPLFYQQ